MTALLLGAIMHAGAGISGTCDPAVVETRGLSGIWVAAGWQRALCQLDAQAGIPWEDCLDAEAEYFACMVWSVEVCEPDCMSVEVYKCPVIHWPVPLTRYFDVPPGGEMLFYAYVDGVCSAAPPDGTSPVLTVDWPVMCEGSTLGDFAACCATHGCG